MIIGNILINKIIYKKEVIYKNDFFFYHDTMKKIIYILIALFILVIVFFYRVKIEDIYTNSISIPVPTSISYEEAVQNMGDVQEEIPAEYNLAVPFMVQAPNANWDMPYQEACEEAVMIMLHYYLQNNELNNDKADEEILKLVEWQNEHYGDYKDTTILETANIMKEYWGYDVQTIDNPSIDMIKEQIAMGRPVLASFYGRGLNNPYYSGEGPLYHMMVIKGYIDNKFITNDPGTKHGQDYMYDYDTIMLNMHDWNDGDVQYGQARIFVVR